MLKVYCQDCGSPTNYSNTKPKFCSSCGKPFDKNIAVNRIELRKPTITKRVLKEEDYDDKNEIYDYEDEDIASVPDINKLDFDITETKLNKIKMGDIISNVPESALANEKKIKINQKNKKSKKIEKRINQEFLNQFKAEAGTLRPLSRKNRNSLDG